MFTPHGFGAHWRQLMQGFLADAEALGAMLVKYEDLAAGTGCRSTRSMLTWASPPTTP